VQIRLDLLNVRLIIIDEMERLPQFSATERLIVELLLEHEELFGLQMVELSAGRLKRGTVYVTLGRMHEKGYLESRQEPLPEGAIGLPRRLYRPTGLAMRTLAAWQTAERSFLRNAQPQEG
jgi:DNA-binding PadR family transcriptional regulator